jgi:hypothetical protein
MIKIDDENVVIPRKTWDELKNDEFFKELIEILEDSNDLEDAIAEADEMFDFDDYDKERMKSINV